MAEMIKVKDCEHRFKSVFKRQGWKCRKCGLEKGKQIEKVKK